MRRARAPERRAATAPGAAPQRIYAKPGGAQGQRNLELRERVIGNALYAWAEAVAMSAGAEVGYAREDMGPPSGEVFRRMRVVRGNPVKPYPPRWQALAQPAQAPRAPRADMRACPRRALPRPAGSRLHAQKAG